MSQSRCQQQSKDALREKCKKIRLELYKNGKLKEISDGIAKKIALSEFFQNSKNVMIFYPKKYEINILGLLDFDKNFYLPRCEKDNIVVCEYKKGDKLQESEFGVLEPCNAPINDLKILDLIIVPALCIDKNGNRLGYGKGFYDRFLNNKKLRAKTFVVAPKCLVFDDIQQDDFDVKCDLIIFE